MEHKKWNSKLHWNNKTKLLTTKWNRKKMNLHNATISGNNKAFHPPNLILGRLTNKELKQVLKKQLGNLKKPNRLLGENPNEEERSDHNPILNRSKSRSRSMSKSRSKSRSRSSTEKVKVTRIKPRPWNITRREELKLRNPTAYSEQQARLNREKY